MAGREEAEEAGGGVGARRAAMRMGYGVRGKSGVEGGEVRRHGTRSGGQGRVAAGPGRRAVGSFIEGRLSLHHRDGFIKFDFDEQTCPWWEKKNSHSVPKYKLFYFLKSVF